MLQITSFLNDTMQIYSAGNTSIAFPQTTPPPPSTLTLSLCRAGLPDSAVGGVKLAESLSGEINCFSVGEGGVSPSVSVVNLVPSLLSLNLF